MGEKQKGDDGTMKTGERIRDLRQREGMTQEALAYVAGLAHMTISRIERGSPRPSMDALRKIATALGVSLDDLAGG